MIVTTPLTLVLWLLKDQFLFEPFHSLESIRILRRVNGFVISLEKAMAEFIVLLMHGLDQM
jgi:hypothetical protein